MKIVGIVVEYNPLHYGHIHHIKKTKELSNADVLIAVMSGHVVQRGNFSIVDKFTKTNWALDAGIDLVIELPTVFTLQSADLFAQTSLSILDKLGVNDIYFGSETGDIEPLKKAASLMREAHFQEAVKLHMNQGYSYPTSTDMAITTLTKNPSIHNLPNNILGIQYIQAIKTLNASITPHAIKRVKTGYYDAINESTNIQSATAIRLLIKEASSFEDYVPDYVYKDLHHYPYIDIASFRDIFTYLLTMHHSKTMHRIFSFEEGFENRLLKVKNWTSVQSLIEQASTSRYTQAKVRRSLMHLLLNIEKTMIDSFTPPYIRVLGMNKAGQQHLNQIKKTLEDANIPLITKLKKDRHLYLDIEIKVTELYESVVQKNLLDKEFSPVIIK